MKYVLLLFTGLLLISCGVSRGNGHLRKFKVDRTPKEVETKEPPIRDWDAIMAEDVVISKGVSGDKVMDEPEFVVSVQSSVKVEDAAEVSVDHIETQGSVREMEVDMNLEEIDSDKVLDTGRKRSRFNQRNSTDSGFSKATIIIGAIVFCIILAYLIIFFPTINWIIAGAVILVLAILIYFLFFGPMIYY